MKSNYLFPHKYKKIGWMILVPSAIFGLITLIGDYEPAFWNWSVPAFFIDEFLGEKKFFGISEENVLNEILGVLTLVGLVLVAFSKEKYEDEFIGKIRLDALVWATYINYAILLIALLMVYGLAFLWVMIFNMFTILLFFIIRFNWLIYKSKTSIEYEEQHQS